MSSNITRGLFPKSLHLGQFKLPPQFNGGFRHERFVISSNRLWYATIKPGEILEINDVPPNRRFSVQGTDISIYPDGSIAMASGAKDTVAVKVRGHKAVDLTRVPQPTFINQDFKGIDTLVVESDGNLEFRLHAEESIKVSGKATQEPLVVDDRLLLGGFKGVVLIPESDLYIFAHTSKGDITGVIANRGIIKTDSGNISVQISGPIRVNIPLATQDRLQIQGMRQAYPELFVPPADGAVDTVMLNATRGRIDIKYREENFPVA